MRFLADENVSIPSIRRMRAEGLDVISVLERSPSLPDPDVIALARRLEAILITFDRDIGELIFGAGTPPPAGVIYLRFVDLHPEETAEVLSALIGDHEAELTGSFLTVRRTSTRIRPLPTPPASGPRRGESAGQP